MSKYGLGKCFDAVELYSVCNIARILNVVLLVIYVMFWP